MICEIVSGGIGLVREEDRRLSALAIEDPHDLGKYREAWGDLANCAVEANPFYEHWMLEPAIRQFGSGRRLIFVFIFACDRGRSADDAVLCGFFPLELSNYYEGLGRRLPLRTLGLWKHKYCYLCTPLVRRGFEAETIKAFFDWLDAYTGEVKKGPALADFRFIPEGPVYRALSGYLSEDGRPHSVLQAFTRAMLCRGTGAQDYLRQSLSGGHRKDFRRKERRLAESGDLEYASLDSASDPGAWVDEYLSVEDRSWKGKRGFSLTSTPGEREFFAEIAGGAFGRGRLMMMSLRHRGRPIASKCNFLAGDGAFAFKIAFDDDFAHWSPGILLEMENVRRLHAGAGLDWMDSCADPSHAMINRLWRERRVVQSMAVALNRRGELALALVPLLKWLNRQVFHRDLARHHLRRPVKIIDM
jgi:hypothetical protein